MNLYQSVTFLDLLFYFILHYSKVTPIVSATCSIKSRVQAFKGKPQTIFSLSSNGFYFMDETCYLCNVTLFQLKVHATYIRVQVCKSRDHEIWLHKVELARLK